MQTLAHLALGAFIGFCIGLTGVGGGILGLQAMTLVVGLDPVRAVGTTSLYIFLTNLTAVFHHARMRTIVWPMVRQMLCGAVPGVVAVSCWVSRKGQDAAFKRGLKTLIAGVVLFSAAVMLANLAAEWRGRSVGAPTGLAERLKGHVRARAVLALLLGCLIGGLIGATSVGGGVLVVPILVLVFGLSGSRTVGSSIAITFALTFIMALIFAHGGALDARTAAVMAAGSLGGVPFGSRLSVRLPDRMLRVIMAVLIAAAAALMLAGRGNGSGC